LQKPPGRFAPIWARIGFQDGAHLGAEPVESVHQFTPRPFHRLNRIVAPHAGWGKGANAACNGIQSETKRIIPMDTVDSEAARRARNLGWFFADSVRRVPDWI